MSYNEQLDSNDVANVVWSWREWKAWFVRKFNPETKVLRKMNEYRNCAQGRSSVDD